MLGLFQWGAIGDDRCNASRNQRIVVLEFVILTRGAFHWTVHHSVATGYYKVAYNNRVKGWVRYFRSKCLSEHCLGLLALAPSYKINFDTGDIIG